MVHGSCSMSSGNLSVILYSITFVYEYVFLFLFF